MRIAKLTFVIFSLVFACTTFADQVSEKKGEEAAAEEQGQFPAKPGPEHKQLQRLVGDWECEISTFQPGQDEATKTQGKAKFVALMGGLFVQQNFQGEMEGVKFRGRGVTGYDQVRKKYVGTWLDSMNSSIMATSGAYDLKTNTLSEIGKMSGPAGEMTLKLVSQYESNDKFSMTMYMVQEDADVKFMRIDYTRKKK